MDAAAVSRHDASMADWVCALVVAIVVLRVGWYANGFVRANQARKNAQAAARKAIPGLTWLRFKLFRQTLAWGALGLALLLLYGWMKIEPPPPATGVQPSPSVTPAR